MEKNTSLKATSCSDSQIYHKVFRSYGMRDVNQQWFIVNYQWFETAYQSHCQWSSIPRRLLSGNVS